ncbi:coenzyme F420-0:L-glutamate ligase [Halobacteriales archaeon QS_9_67_15]|nr:MAG: coenzyme F420-0:L-glutamate ligase [Halobacteriales archaeon QS_9_67_15]
MELFAVDGLPEVRPGDDVGELIAERVDLREDDVVCVSHSIVSKAEGRQADLSEFDPGDRAMWIADRIGDLAGEARDPRFAQAVLDESAELLTEEPLMLAVTHFGHISVNAGIDRSNVPDADLLLLPEDPSASAERIHGTLGAPVIVTDTSGRPFRQGQRGVAIGLAGMPAARDWRGESDRDGRDLGVTVEAVADELAAAANLLTGEGDDGLPVVVVRGFEFGDHEPSEGLFRAENADYVRDALREWDYDKDRLRQVNGHSDGDGDDDDGGGGADDGDRGDGKTASPDADAEEVEL